MNTVHILLVIALIALVIACELCRQLTGICKEQRELIAAQDKRLEELREHMIARLIGQRRKYKRKWEAIREVE